MDIPNPQVEVRFRRVFHRQSGLNFAITEQGATSKCNPNTFKARKKLPERLLFFSQRDLKIIQIT
jgi:hypothetical protein